MKHVFGRRAGYGLLLAGLLAGAAHAAPRPEPLALSIAQVRSLMGEWQDSDGELDRQAIQKLAAVGRDVSIRVFFGPACHDSRAEVPRLLAALSQLAKVRFSVEFFAVGRQEMESGELARANDIAFLPTLIVSRHGQELGRIVERPSRRLETDLALLLEGKTAGLISSSERVIWHYLSPSTPPNSLPGPPEVPESLTAPGSAKRQRAAPER